MPHPPTPGEGEFLPVLTSETDRHPSPPPAERGDDRAPKGTPGERQAILGGLPPGSLGQTVDLPVPRLVHDFRLSARLDRRIALGQSCWGERNWIGIRGGEWSAPWGKGKIVVRRHA